MTETQLDRSIALIATIATIISALLMCKQTLDQQQTVQASNSKNICSQAIVR